MKGPSLGPRRGVQTDGVLVQRWVDSALNGSGTQPREILLTVFGRFSSKIGIPHDLLHLVGKLCSLRPARKRQSRKGTSAVQAAGGPGSGLGVGSLPDPLS